MHHLTHNPFYILELNPTASHMEIERSGQKILGMLELGLSDAHRYRTPAGEYRRDQDAVRQAMAELKDPRRRLLHELWARLPPDTVVELGGHDEDLQAPLAGWPEALSALGWSRP